jgi:hypothetical protein
MRAGGATRRHWSPRRIRRTSAADHRRRLRVGSRHGDVIDEGTRRRELLDAQAKAAQLFAAVESQHIVRPGTTDKAASKAVTDLAAELLGVKKHWHKRIIRSGPNTLRPYQDNPPDRTMTDDDIVLADFGPIFEGWEADFGRPWVIGADDAKLRLRDDLQTVFDAGKRHFDTHPDITGEQLYAEVVALSEGRRVDLRELALRSPRRRVPARELRR